MVSCSQSYSPATKVNRNEHALASSDARHWVTRSAGCWGGQALAWLVVVAVLYDRLGGSKRDRSCSGGRTFVVLRYAGSERHGNAWYRYASYQRGCSERCCRSQGSDRAQCTS